MADDVTLLPCPWCAGTDLLRPMQDAWEKWLIGCRSCGAEGPQADDPAMTITAWNTRATPRTPEPVYLGGAPDHWRESAYHAADAVIATEARAPDGRTFALSDRVEKRTGSSWRGHIVGFYSTTLTPEGYAVESEREPGSVQIYPVAALAAVEPAR